MQLTYKMSSCASAFRSVDYQEWFHEKLNEGLQEKIDEYNRIHSKNKFTNYKYFEKNYYIADDMLMFERTVTFEIARDESDGKIIDINKFRK